MAINSITGGNTQLASIDGPQGQIVVSNNNASSGSPPSFLTELDLDFSASNTSILGIRLPLRDSISDNELLMALIENEDSILANKRHGNVSLSGRIGAKIAESGVASVELGKLKAAAELAEAQKIQFLGQKEAALVTLQEQTTLRASLEGQIASLNNEIANLNAQLMPLNNQISNLNEAIDASNAEISSLEGQITSINNNIADLEGQPGDHAAEINSLKAQRDDLVAQRENAITERDTNISRRDTAIAERAGASTNLDGKIASRDEVVAQKQAVDNIIVNLNASILAIDISIAEKDADLERISAEFDALLLVKEGIDLFILQMENRKRADALSDAASDINNHERFRESFRNILKGRSLQFWDEFIQKRSIKSAQTKESGNPADESVGRLATFALVRNDFSESLSKHMRGNPTSLSGHELDKISSDNAFRDMRELMGDLINVKNAIDAVSQPEPQRDVQQGRVMLSLT